MLIVGSALEGYAIEASDGRIGTVNSFLFDETTWKIRWLVIDTGNGLSERRVLVHPLAIGNPDHQNQHLPVRLTKAQVEVSSNIEQNRPVTMQMQSNLYGSYGSDPYWGSSFYGSVGFGFGPRATLEAIKTFPAQGPLRKAETMQMRFGDGDPHLRDMTALVGYHIHASDGAIGHVENFLLNDDEWAIRYLIVDTRNYGPGAHVLIAPYAVEEIDWSNQEMRLNVRRDYVKTSLKWRPGEIVEHVYKRQLHNH